MIKTATIKKILAILCFTSIMIIGLTGCGGEAPSASSDAATSEGESTAPQSTSSEKLTLTVYGSCAEEQVAAVCKAFEASSGIKTSFVRMGTGEVYARIKEEKDHPQAGVWFGGPNDSYIQAADEGLLEPYEAQNASNLLDPKFRDSDGNWYGIYTSNMAFICNKELLEEKGLAIPTSWEDLLDPAYHNCIAYANPNASGVGYNVLSTLMQLMGEEDAKNYMKALDANIKQYPKSGGGPVRLVATGELEIAVGILGDGITQQKAGYDNIVMTYPSEGTGYEIGGVAIIKGNSQMEAAKQFIEFTLTPECQNLYKDVGSYQFLTVNGGENPVEGEAFGEPNLINYDFAWSGENRSRLIAEWNELITGDKVENE